VQIPQHVEKTQQVTSVTV